MKARCFHVAAGHEWFVVSDAGETRLVDANVYMLRVEGRTLLCDPGGHESFSEVFAAVTGTLQPDSIRDAFVSHQDPDVSSAMPLWDACVGGITWHLPAPWEGFVRHSGALRSDVHALPDEAADIMLGDARLQVVPAHYLHAAANLHLYDPVAKVLFSGDVGAALLPAGHGVLVDAAGFDEHIRHAEYFHKRWMPSAAAKRDWCERVSRLDIDFLCPQHGAIYAGANVRRFIDWFDALPVACALA